MKKLTELEMNSRIDQGELIIDDMVRGVRKIIADNNVDLNTNRDRALLIDSIVEGFVDGSDKQYQLMAAMLIIRLVKKGDYGD